jgi:hypothetical protein
MGHSDKLLSAVLSGRKDANLRFADLRKVVLGVGFEERVRGDHHIFSRDGVAEIINLQPRTDGTAKPYQVKQVRQIITKYRLAPEP